MIKGALTQEIFNSDPDYEEEWVVVMNTKGVYRLSKIQARLLQQEIANGNRGTIMFQTFSISIPYMVEFYRDKRFLKNAKQLSARASEEPYKPIDPEKWKKMKEELFSQWAKKEGDKK